MPDKVYTTSQFSKFNSAAQEISRIHELYNRCHQCMEKGQLDDANYKLDIIWLELVGDKNINSDEVKDFYSFHSTYAKIKKERGKVWQYLLRKETFLKKIQNRIGKGSKYQEEDDSGM